LTASPFAPRILPPNIRPPSGDACCLYIEDKIISLL
jgi:hypothetical protein